MLYRFHACALDLVRGCLRVDSAEMSLRPKSFEVLRYLVQHPGRLILKDDLIKVVWPNTIVTDESLTNCISDVRRAIGDHDQTIIKTVPRRGYVFTAAVAQEPVDLPGSNPDPWALDQGLQEKPSIAVLAFTNMSGDPSQEYFSDGITEDIITELSRFSELLVIARNSTFTYKGKAVDVRQIGRELGVRYVLEGSIRRDGDRVRISAQLVDAINGAHRWVERYDRGLQDALSVQDEVARQIVAVLAVHVRKVEAERILAKPPAVWQAYDYYLRAVDSVTAYHASYEKEALFRGRRLLRRALAIDPTYARAQAVLSSCYMSQWVHRWDDDCPWTEALDRSYQAARESVRLAPDLPEAHVALGQALTFLRQHEAAVAAVERATALNPNLTSFRFAYTYILAGEAARAAQLLEIHMRLDPFYEPNAPMALGFAYNMLARYGEALPLLQEAVSRAPDMAHGRYTLATTYARLGKLEEARTEVEYALRLEPWYRISQSLTARYFKRPEDTEHLVTGLRMAGFPE
jgi:adenylate cyclase